MPISVSDRRTTKILIYDIMQIFNLDNCSYLKCVWNKVCYLCFIYSRILTLNTGMQCSAGTFVKMYLQYKDAVVVKKDIKHQIAVNVKKATIEILLKTFASVSD